MRFRKGGERQRLAADPTDTAATYAEIEHIQTLKPDKARALWREIFKRDVPRALTRDLVVRTLCWHIQEKTFGGHSPAMLRLLDNYAKGKPREADSLRRLKPGTEVVREYQGERHTVVITADGFRWQDKEYASLSAIARVITGSNRNGPRFFGLREGGADKLSSAAPTGMVDRLRSARVLGRKVGPDEYAPQTVPLRHLHPQIDRT